MFKTPQIKTKSIAQRHAAQIAAQTLSNSFALPAVTLPLRKMPTEQNLNVSFNLKEHI